MKSRHRVWFKWFLALSFFLALGLTYAQIGLFPGQLREKATLRLKQATHQDIHFDKAVYFPFSGLNLYGVRWYKDNGEMLFSAKRVAANVKIIPFFRQKKIIVDRFVLDTPVYDWVAGQPRKAAPPAPKTMISGQIDVPVVDANRPYKLEDIASGPDSFLPENVYLEQIEITNGVVRIRAGKNAPVSEVIHSIHVRMGYQKPPVIRFDGNIVLGTDSYASVGLNGNWDLKKGVYTFKLKTNSRKVPDWLLAYQKNNFLKLLKGRLYLETQIWNGARSLVLFHTHTDLKEAEISVSPSSYHGHMKLEAEGAFDPVYRKFEQYKGNLKLMRVSAMRVSPQIDSVSALEGDIHFEKDLLNIRSLRGEFKQIGFEASGVIRSFKELLLDGEIRSKLSLDQVRALLPPEMLKKIADFKIDGLCQTSTRLTGSLKKGASVSTQHKIRLSEGSISNIQKNIHLKQVSGDLYSARGGFEIRNLKFIYGKETVHIDGNIPPNAPPSGKLRAASRSLDLRTDYTLQGSDIVLSNATLRLPGASLVFRGKVRDWQKPYLLLEGQALIDLKRSIAWAAQTQQALKKTQLDGVLEGPFTFSGRADDWLSSDIKLDAKAERILVNGTIKLDDVSIQIRKKGHFLNIPYFHSKFYGGPLGISWAIDLSRAPATFVATLYANQVDLKRMARDLPEQAKKLSGTLMFNASVNGVLQDRASWRGNGALSITNGLIFQTDKFKAMGQLPLVRVEGLDWVTFHEMNTEFKLTNEKILTEKMILKGDTVDLSLNGAVSLNGQLDLLMDISYSDDVFRGAQATGGIANFMVLEAGRFISQHRLSGTLKEPVVEKNLLPSGRSVGKSIGGLVQKIVR